MALRNRSESLLRLTIHVQPGAPRTQVGGRYGSGAPPILRVRVTARAVGGAGNRAVVAAVAEALGLPRRAVTIVTGERSRTKVLEVTGADPSEVTRLLSEAP